MHSVGDIVDGKQVAQERVLKTKQEKQKRKSGNRRSQSFFASTGMQIHAMQIPVTWSFGDVGRRTPATSKHSINSYFTS
jgi:hypothetical protein